MYDNNKDFESQVRARLDDLDFIPSPSVWDKIDAELPAEKKRGRGFLFFSSLLLGAAAVCGYLFFNQNTTAYQVNTSTLSSSVTSQQPVTSVNKSATTLNEPLVSSENEATSINKSTIASRKEATSINESAIASGKDNKTGTTHTAIRKSEDNNKNINASSLPVVHRTTTRKQEASIPVNKSEDGIKIASAIYDEETLAGAPLKPADVALPVYHNGFNLDFPIKNIDAPASAASSVQLTQKKWGFELTASGGQSIYNSGRVKNMFTAAQSAVLNDRMPPSTNGLWLPPLTPSDVKPGKSFSLGVDARYKLTERVSFTAGLHYNLLTTKIKTGDRIENQIRLSQPPAYEVQVDRYYNVGYYNDYTNKYHFIEVPVLAHFQLNRGRKLPLSIDGGLSIAQLINTNTLHYDANSNVYFEDKSLVKKTFLNAQGGVTAKLFANKRFPVIVGPKIQYGLTNLFKGKVISDNRDKHSLMIGLKLGVPLNF